MGEHKHTPGPWEVSKAGRSVLAGGVKINQSIGPFAASVGVQNRIDAELRANAKLIAAAPELLAACELALQDMIRWGIFGPGRNAVEAAIKKARGE